MMKKIIAMMGCAVLAGMLVCISPPDQQAKAQWQVPPYTVPIGSPLGGTGFKNSGPVYYVGAFGATGNGTTDDTAAIASALTASSGGTLIFAQGTYKVTSQLTVPAATRILGYGATISKGANIDLINLGAAAQLVGITLAGNGGTFTGKVVDITSGNDQRLINVNATSCNGPCVEVALDTGIRLQIIGGFYQRTTATNPSILLVDSGDETNGDRIIVDVITGGGWLVDTGGSATTLIQGNDFVNMITRALSKKVQVVGNRIATGGTDLTIDGSEGVYVGNTLAGGITIASGAANNRIGTNRLGGDITDSSGNETNGTAIDMKAIWAETAAPGSPSAGFLNVWADSTHSILKAKNSGGVTTITIVPSDAVANQFMTGIGVGGVVTRAQPAASNLSNGTTGTGAVVLANTPTLITPEIGLATGSSLTLSSTGQAFVSLVRYSDNANGPLGTMRKSRGTTVGTQGIVASGDVAFDFEGRASDGVGFIQLGRILMQVDGTPGVNDMPGRMAFFTTADGASSATERLRISQNGNISVLAGTVSLVDGASGNLVVGNHVRAGGAAPALSSCGTTPAISGSDFAGEVTMGTGAPTGCVITFNVEYSSTPYCTVSWQATPLASQSYAISTSAITLTQTATSSNKVNYVCSARLAG